MKIRRYKIDTVFKTLNEINLHSNIPAHRSKFICIPRYNVCINLRPSSIRFFFENIYKVRTYKTYFIWSMMWLVSLIPFMHHILKIFRLQYELVNTKSYKNINWGGIDLIYVEWHFFGIFSKEKNTVTHVLAKEAYRERFKNELRARKKGKKFIELFPKLLFSSNDPKFYIEELAVDSGMQFISKKQFEKSQKKLKQINKKTLKLVDLDSYYSKLIHKIGNLKNENLSLAFQKLKNQMESNYLQTNAYVELALVHGDFNKGQILIKDNAIKIIDWGDGGVLNRFFDYISISIYKSPDHTFKHKYFPKEFSVLRDFFRKKLKSNYDDKIYVLITLLEILAISKGEFEAQEGAYPRWQTAVTNNCQ